jgi:hypothetical protein
MNRTRPDASQQVTNVAELRHVTDVLKLSTPLTADDSSSENLLKTIPAMQLFSQPAYFCGLLPAAVDSQVDAAAERQ